jgi:NAD(P)-dependent dehydrogenase (short-subunit alcohol dehydrogenase family)
VSFDWTGKIAIVTGGGSGLGRDSSFSLANSGATVVIADIDRASGERVVGEIKQLQRETTFIELDVADSHEVNEMARSVIECFGGINILVNSAGITRRLPPLDFP